jgi:hypothetical protein
MLLSLKDGLRPGGWVLPEGVLRVLSIRRGIR